jgi:Fe-S-cluster containining protein
MEATKYPCTGCGSCCKRVSIAVDNLEPLGSRDKESELYFPYTWDDNGVCSMLNKDDNTCTVYNDRPKLCNIEFMAELFDIDRDLFFAINIPICNQMMDDDNVEQSYRIKQ